jgi:hypothetical protein
LYENKKTNFDCVDSMTGKELKDKYNETMKSEEDMRLFFGGAEIRDEHKLYQHNLKDEYIIQILKKQNFEN